MNGCNKAYNDFFRATKGLRLYAIFKGDEIVGKICGHSSLTGKTYYMSVLISLPQYHGGYSVRMTGSDKDFNQGLLECLTALKGDLNKIGLFINEETIKTDFIHEFSRVGLKVWDICGGL